MALEKWIQIAKLAHFIMQLHPDQELILYSCLLNNKRNLIS